MVTREEVIAEYEAELLRIPEDQRDQPIFNCQCGEHILSFRQILEAMKDPSNKDGQAFLAVALQNANV